MSKIWQIIKYEYRRHVFQKKFIISLLSLPIAVVAMVLVALIIAYFATDSTPVGYVDRSGVVRAESVPQGEGSLFEPVIEFQAYQNTDQAQTALDAGEIQAYFLIPENYPGASLDIELFFFEEPGSGIREQFIKYLRENLDTLETIDPIVRDRLQSGSNITITSLDGSRTMNQDQWFMIFTPFVAGLMFFIVVMTSGGYLLQAVVEEKENRTMEIMVTSVSPSQLMTGKIIGNIAVGLTQLFVWLIFGWIALKIGGFFWPVLQDFSLPTNYVLVLFLVLLPSFVMVAAIMSAIGSTMTETREAQQISSLFSLPIMIPYYLASPIMMNPNSILAIALSFFPLTAPVTILVRMAVTVVPLWQIVLNVLILILFAIAAIWFAGRAFRMGMLRYGKKLSIKEVLGKAVE